ncbi:MAG: hypothetical protein AAGI46_03460 [Planctomycetota bacterium]
MNRPIALVALLAFSGTPALAQQAASPFWNAQDANATPPAAEEQPSTGFPTRLASEVAPSHAEAVRLRLAANEARVLAQAREAEVRNRVTPAVEVARDELSAAMTDLVRAKQDVVDELSLDPEYAAAGDLAASIDARLARLRSAGEPASATTRALAAQALDYDLLQSAREKEAFADSQAVASARLRVDAARDAVREALAEVERAVSADGELATLRAEARRLRIDAAAARAYAEAAQRSADLALDFARREAFAAQQPRFDGRYYDPDAFGFGYRFGPFFRTRPIIGFPIVGQQLQRPTPVITNVFSNP